jgi:hypothetical protein
MKNPDPAVAGIWLRRCRSKKLILEGRGDKAIVLFPIACLDCLDSVQNTVQYKYM